MKKVAIVGSCVSRELFRDGEAPDFDVSFYCMHTCIPAIAAEPTPLPSPVEETALSPFFKRNLKRDFTKSLFAELEGVDFDVVVIDCVEERYNLFMRGNEVISRSAALTSTDFKDYCETTMEEVKRLDLPIDYFDDHVKSFTQNLLKASRGKPIILNMCHFVKYHLDGNAIIYYERESVRKQNLLLDHIYGLIMKEGAGNITAIDTRDINFRGHYQHRWGPFPFHFEDAFYAYVLGEIRKMMAPRHYDVMSMHEYHGSENSSQLWDDWHEVQSLHVAGKDADCIQMVEKIRSVRKLTPMECHYAGRSYLRIPGHHQEALHLLTYAVDFRSDEGVWANLFLAKCRRELHDPFGALVALSTAVELFDNNAYAATMILEEYCELIGNAGFNADNYTAMREGLRDFCRRVPMGRP